MHLTSSRFFGGPEQQMLGLAQELRPQIGSSFVSFSEKNLCETFLTRVRAAGFVGITLKYDTPRLASATMELERQIKVLAPEVLCTHGYKSNLIGLFCARKLRLPIVSISHGWTSESFRVCIYEWLDRKLLSRMDRVVAVSHGQAAKVCRANVALQNVEVIHDAICTDRFSLPSDPKYRRQMASYFNRPLRFIVGAAGRLSPEKGFDVLIDAIRLLKSRNCRDLAFVLFGEGRLYTRLQCRIESLGLQDYLFLAGFTTELDKYMRAFDLFVQSSFTEGLPNVLLEAAAAGVPVVATNVGGTAEVVASGRTGVLVPSGNAHALAEAILSLLSNDALRSEMSEIAKAHVAGNFNFVRQAASYHSLFQSLIF